MVCSTYYVRFMSMFEQHERLADRAGRADHSLDKSDRETAMITSALPI